jgi:hypothetical protein
MKQPIRVASFFIQADEGGLAWHPCAGAWNGIATQSRMASRDSVYDSSA